MKITSKTNKQLHALLKQHNMTEYKADLILQITGGETSSASELTEQQAKELISDIYKSVEDSANTMRRKVIGLLCESKMQFMKNGDGSANMHSIYSFVIKKGYLKKPLNAYTKSELPQLVSQIEKIVSSYEKS